MTTPKTSASPCVPLSPPGLGGCVPPPYRGDAPDTRSASPTAKGDAGRGTQSSTVYGLDLSLTGTGISDGRFTWLVATNGKRGDTLARRGRRLGGIRGSVLLATGDADLVVIEGPSLGQTRQSGTHDRAGLWWLIVADLLDRGTPVVEVPPASLKKYATGKGNANKGAIVDATARRFPDVDTGSGDDNRCDALWLAQMGLDYLTGSGVVPAAQRAVLHAVTWPDTSTDQETA